MATASVEKAPLVLTRSSSQAFRQGKRKRRKEKGARLQNSSASDPSHLSALKVKRNSVEPGHIPSLREALRTSTVFCASKQLRGARGAQEHCGAQRTGQLCLGQGRASLAPHRAGAPLFRRTHGCTSPASARLAPRTRWGVSEPCCWRVLTCGARHGSSSVTLHFFLTMEGKCGG